MTAEQKPGWGICIRHPNKALNALGAKLVVKLTPEGPGTSRVLRTTTELLTQEGKSIPEITEKLAKQKQAEGITFIAEATQMEDSTL